MPNNKTTYIRMARDAARPRAFEKRGPARSRFIEALDELLNKCPDITIGEIKELVATAKQELVR